MKDEEIIELYWQRNDRAITATAAKYGLTLEHMAVSMVVYEDAQECVNDTYLSAWNHIPPTRPNYFFAWLSKVCRNLCLNRLEKNRAMKRNVQLIELDVELEQCLPDANTEFHPGGEQLGKLISDFLRTLSQEKRVIFLRRYWFGDSVKEIAQQWSFSESKVKTMLHRIRSQLREYLEKEGVYL